jgi:hypothetical protein
MCSAQDWTAARDVHFAIFEIMVASFPSGNLGRHFVLSLPRTGKIKIYHYAGLPKYRQFTYSFRI